MTQNELNRFPGRRENFDSPDSPNSPNLPDFTATILSPFVIYFQKVENGRNLAFFSRADVDLLRDSRSPDGSVLPDER